ncbi:MAG: glycosyltransferase family 4 protein [Deltaproteobacteria bacterium]|nr:glycosyltransferase family 4 protein [Deltaproteobacteria bacterium]
MRVLHITRDLLPAVTGGISIAVDGLLQACCALDGVECAAISFDGYRPCSRPGTAAPVILREDGARVLRVRGGDAPDRALRFAFEFGPEVVCVHHAMLWALAEQLRARRAELRSLLFLHALQGHQDRLHGLERPTRSALDEMRAVSRADRIAVGSRAAEQILVGAFPEQADRIRLCRPGIRDSAEAARSADSHARGACAAGPLLYTGRFADLKGTFDLLDAFAILSESKQARLVVAGGVPDRPRSEMRWRRRLMDRLPEPARERVAFVGWLDREALANQLLRASMLVCPGRFETFGQSALEGMLFGLAVVATRAGGQAELIEHGHSGLLCEPGDVPALAAAIERLLAEPDLAIRLGRTAAEQARSQHLWDGRAGEIAHLLGELA